MCTTNSRRICFLCILLYCFTCVKPGRNPNVPRGSRPRSKTEAHVEIKVDDTQPDKYYMEKDYFVNELLKKYGDGTKISYEGLEHLLHNLGLGKIEHMDHGIDAHKFGDGHSHNGHSHDHTHSHDDHTHSHDDNTHSHDDHTHSHDDHTHSHDDHIHSHDDHTHSHDNNTHSLDDNTHSHDDHTHSHDNSSHTDGHTNDKMKIQTTTTSHITDSIDDNHGNNITNHTHTITHEVRKRSTDNDECLPAKTLYQSVKSSTKASLTKYDLKELCPALIYQLDEGSCKAHNSLERAHGHSHDECHGHAHDHEHKTTASKIDFSQIPAKVWGYSTIAVVIISLVGLLGVAVIPIMQKVFYNHLLQFLVASAVGALAGDALLHLIPHAMGGHDHSSHGEDDGHGHGGHDHDPTMIYKGLCGLMGIYFFFWTERLLTIFTESKRKKKEMKNKGKKFVEDASATSKVGDQCDGMMMSIHPNKALQNYAMEAHNEHCTKEFDANAVSHRHGPCPNNDIESISNHEERISMIGDTPKVRHGHGHSHGIDGVPTSVASVAWMVILGDGIHNLCDGLAIGAAFVNSTTGGFSTSIAVLCHELPHEIGDFAMLLRAGMSAKQAIIYNCVSSILCFVGMLIGVAIGNVGGASLWVFVVVAGMFLYIALVDMLPELSSVDTKKGEHPLCHLLIQSAGMLLGAGIMLMIALYEEQLITLLE